RWYGTSSSSSMLGAPVPRCLVHPFLDGASNGAKCARSGADQPPHLTASAVARADQPPDLPPSLPPIATKPPPSDPFGAQASGSSAPFSTICRQIARLIRDHRDKVSPFWRKIREERDNLPPSARHDRLNGARLVGRRRVAPRNHPGVADGSRHTEPSR